MTHLRHIQNPVLALEGVRSCRDLPAATDCMFWLVFPLLTYIRSVRFTQTFYAEICAVFDMPERCIVAGCSNTSKDGVSLHRFAKDEKLRSIWTSKVKLARGKWLGPSPTSVICSDHFTDDDFDPAHALHLQFGLSKHRLLKKDAVPSWIKPPKRMNESEQPGIDNADKRCKKRVSWPCPEIGRLSACQPNIPPIVSRDWCDAQLHVHV